MSMKMLNAVLFVIVFLAVGLTKTDHVQAQHLFGDDLVLEGLNGNPFIRFEHSNDGMDAWITGYENGTGFFFDETASYPFFINFDAPNFAL